MVIVPWFVYYGMTPRCKKVPNKLKQEAKVIWRRLHRMRYTHCTRRSVQLQPFQRYKRVKEIKVGHVTPRPTPYDLLLHILG